MSYMSDICQPYVGHVTAMCRVMSRYLLGVPTSKKGGRKPRDRRMIGSVILESTV